MHCPEFEEALLDGARLDEPPADLGAHLARCAECMASWERLRAHARALAGVTRRAAPWELEGRVVAAMNSGYRQERVADQIRALPPQPVPAELEARVAFGLRAPSVLERLVREQIESDPGAALTRRATRKLRRVRAPRELAGHVERSLGERRLQRRLLRLRLVLGTGAVLLVLGAVWSARDGARDASGGESFGVTAGGRSIPIRDVSYANLDPNKKRILGMFGGFPEVEER